MGCFKVIVVIGKIPVAPRNRPARAHDDGRDGLLSFALMLLWPLRGASAMGCLSSKGRKIIGRDEILEGDFSGGKPRQILF